jgi:hypothetical protein
VLFQQPFQKLFQTLFQETVSGTVTGTSSANVSVFFQEPFLEALARNLLTLKPFGQDDSITASFSNTS